MYIGIDVGGTNTRIVASESLENPSFVFQKSFDTQANFETGVKRITDALQKLPAVTAIAIGMPGSIEHERAMDDSINLSGWANQPLSDFLHNAFSCPIFVLNDAEMGALGEAYYGSTEQKDFFYLTWGTGLGCAQVVWKDGVAMVSHPKDGKPIHLLDRKIGGVHIPRNYRSLAHELDDTQWDHIINEFVATLPKLAEAYGFERFVLGGGITVKQKKRIAPVLADLQYPIVRMTELKGEAGLYGAFALLLHQGV